MRSTDFPFAVMPQRLQGGGLAVDYSRPSADVADVVDPTDFVGRDTLASEPVSWRDQLRDRLAVMVGRRNADMIVDVADFTPLGAAFVGNEAKLAAQKGRKGEAAANMALAALPLPGVGKVAKKAVKGAKATGAVTKVAAQAKTTPSPFHTPRQTIAKEYSRDIAQRLDGIVPDDAPLSEWREAAERLSSQNAGRPNARFTPEFKRPGEEPVVTQAGRQGLPVRGMDLVEAQHPSPFGVFSKYKTPKDPLETDVVFERYADMPTDRLFDTSLLENARVVSLLADKARAGDVIRSVDGMPTEVYTQGGPLYPALQEALGGSSVFASEFGALTPVRRQIAEALEAGRPVFGVTTTMGPGALNQTIDMTDLLHQMARTSPIRKSDLAVFNKKARSLFPGYAGLLDEDAAQQLHTMTQGQRKSFVELLDNAEAAKRGFPSVPAARFSLTDPNLVDVPAGASGYSFVELGPESLSSIDSIIKHRTYPDDMGGVFRGRGPLVPFSTMFSDATKARRAAGAPAGSDLRSLELKKHFQDMTPEAYDLFMKYLSKIDDPY